MSRQDMSFPIVYPTICPRDEITSPSSGSGTIHFESSRSRSVCPVDRHRRTFALKKISGRGASYTRSYALFEMTDSSIRATRDRWYVTPAAHTSCDPIGNPGAAGIFNCAMVEITRIVAPAAVQRIEQRGARRIVDVGGGYGELLAAFLARWPSASGLVLDLGHAASGARRHFEQSNLTGRAQFMCGDFFESVPQADLLLMKSVLHDWNDERCAVLLRNARRALSDDGRLIVLDRVLPDRMGATDRDRDQARSDLTMLVGVGGRERTESELRHLISGADFAVDSVDALPLGLSVLVCRPA